MTGEELEVGREVDETEPEDIEVEELMAKHSDPDKSHELHSSGSESNGGMKVRNNFIVVMELGSMLRCFKYDTPPNRLLFPILLDTVISNFF